MRRRALLASTALALLSSSGCLSNVRRQQSGPIRLGHARVRLHDADHAFVRGGVGGNSEVPYGASLFVEPPPSDVSVFTDALGAETQRQWDNEVHNENYDDGFLVLAQVRTPRTRATTLNPVPTTCDPGWVGLGRARVPMGLQRVDLEPEEIAGASELVSTAVVYLESADSPEQVRVPFLSPRADSCERANATLTVEPRS